MIFFKSIFLFFILTSFSYAFECNKKNVRLEVLKIINISKYKIELLNKIKFGSVSENISVKEVFGHDFSKVKVNNYLNELKKKRLTDDSILEDHSSILSCLDQHDLDSQKAKLRESLKELLKQKITFLDKNKERLSLNQNVSQLVGEIPSIKNDIIAEKEVSSELKASVQQEIINSEHKLSISVNSNDKSFFAYITMLNRLKLDIIRLNLRYSDILEKELAAFDKYNKTLITISNDNSSSSGSIENFEKINLIWIDVVSNAFDIFKGDSLNYNFPNVPDLPSIFKSLSENEQKLVKENISELRNLKNKFITIISEQKNRRMEIQNALLLQINSLRSKLFDNLSFSYILKQIIEPEFWKLIKVELIASPYRVISFFYTKYLYVDEQISKGFQGFKVLLFDLVKIFFLLFIVLITNFVLKKVYDLINRSIIKLVYNLKKFSIVKYTNTFWNKFKDSFIDVSWILILNILLSYDEFYSFRLVLEILSLFLSYRVLKRFITSFLGILASVDSGSYLKFKIKSTRSSEFIARLYFFYFISLLVFESVLGRTYIYMILKSFTLICFIYLLFKVSKEWEVEIKKYIEKNVSGVLVAKFDVFMCYVPPLIKPFFLLLFLFSITLLNFFIYVTEDFNVSKKISANLFKKQIENSSVLNSVNSILPKDYLDMFDLKSLDDMSDYVTPDNLIFDSAFKSINEWLDNPSEEHTLLVYGDKGVGKTTFLKKLMVEVEAKDNDLSVLYSKVPSKLLSKEKITDYIANLLGLGENITKIDPSHVKNVLSGRKIIFLDEVQNIFISNPGYYEGYYSLFNIFNLNIDNVFWVLSFNRFSWLYLDKAFGKKNYVRLVYEYKGWSDLKIKELIKKRHSQTDFSLSYDVLISATKSEEEVDKYSSIENKFFKLLWELSNGNPRAALYLWTKSLKYSGSKSLIVNIPNISSNLKLHSLSDDVLFVLAAILKHENLGVKDIEKVTSLPVGVCRNSIKIGIESSLIFKDSNNKYMIDMVNQYAIIKHLRSKNFIYGS